LKLTRSDLQDIAEAFRMAELLSIIDRDASRNEFLRKDYQAKAEKARLTGKFYSDLVY